MNRVMDRVADSRLFWRIHFKLEAKSGEAIMNRVTDRVADSRLFWAGE
jgi:hypothetical protein